MNRTLLACYLLLAALLGTGRAAQAQNVGLGTSAPTQALDVNGQVRVRGAQGSAAGRLLGFAPDGTLQAQNPTFGAPAPVAFAQPVGQGAVATAGSPQGVVANAAGTRAFVINGGSNTLETFDLSAGRPRSLGTVPLYGPPSDVSLNAAGTRLYVVADAVWTFDVSSGVPVYLSSVSYSNRSYNAVLNAAGTCLYVLSEQIALVVVPLDAAGKPAAYTGATFAAGGLILKDVAVNPASTRAYVLAAGYSSSSMLQTYEVSGPGNPPLLSSVPLSGAPEALALNAAGTRAYVVSTGGNTLETFDLSGALPVSLGTVPTGPAPRAVALNAAGTRLYVPNAGSNTLQVYDISGTGLPASLYTMPTGNAPLAVAAAPAGPQLYVANAGDNTLQVFDQQNQPRPLAVGATGAAGSLGAGALPGAGRLPVAYGTVGSTGVASGSGSVFSVVHSATGVYRLSFTGSPLSTTDLNQATTVATLAGVAPGSVSYRTGRGYVEVLTYAPGGGAADRGFTFSVALP